MKSISFREVKSVPGMMEAKYVLEKEEGKWMLTLARGQCRTGGYDVCLQEVSLDEGVLKARVELVNPAPRSFVTMVITFPVRKYELLLTEEPKRAEIVRETGEVLAVLDF